jgi:hypothetical protein
MRTIGQEIKTTCHRRLANRGVISMSLKRGTLRAIDKRHEAVRVHRHELGEGGRVRGKIVRHAAD